MNIETTREFLGWCTAINLGFLMVMTIKLLALQNWASKIHAKWFNIDEESVRQVYFQFLAAYKIALLIFNVAPYIALRIMT